MLQQLGLERRMRKTSACILFCFSSLVLGKKGRDNSSGDGGNR
jgi:hypothetical protein